MRATGAHDFPRGRESKFVCVPYRSTDAPVTTPRNWVPAFAGTTVHLLTEERVR